MVKPVANGKPYVYTFVYRVLIAGEEYLPYISIKMGPKEEFVEGQAVGDDYFITSVEIPPELITCPSDMEVAIMIKCKSTSTFHMYDYCYNDLNLIHADVFVWLDRQYYPGSTTFQRPWTTSAGLVMKNDVLNRFSYDLAKGQRLAIGDNLSMALIDNPYLASMLRWGTSKGKFVAVYPRKLSTKFVNHGKHYHEILEDSRRMKTQGAFAALKQMAQELQNKPSKSKKSGILGRLRNSFSRLKRRQGL